VNREQINDRIQDIIDHQTAAWGVKVTIVEIRDIDLPQDMQRAMARQAEAERERRAKIIKAEGEYQAAEKLTEAAEIMSRNDTTIQLRYLETLRDISVEQNSTILFPLPIEMLKAFGKRSSDNS
jgi:regulator of protease activity HflC (stomatin/prohibitin superfamily)